MTTSTTQMTTAHASKYLQQLGKHFGHKVPATFTPTDGKVRFPFGSCQMEATPEALTLTVSGDTGDIDRLEQIMGDHLARFAFRENPTLNWQRAV